MRTAASPKHSSHPIYPRPVSPLHYEPLYTCPEDLLFEQESDESGNDEEIRAAKRRRIEKLGQQYLRGDGLFILTASIKGPLGEGWSNPWKKTRRKADGLQTKGKSREVPETVGKVERDGVGRNVNRKQTSVERNMAVPEQAADEIKVKHTEAVSVEKECGYQWDVEQGSNPRRKGEQ